MSEVEEVGQHWQETASAMRSASGEAAGPEMIDAGPREVSEEEWQRICKAEQGFAETNFGRRNPLA